MITSNPEHKKAILKKLIQIGKSTVALTLAGVATTVTIFTYTNIIKEHEVTVESESFHGTTISNTLDMVTGEETLFRESLIDHYKERLEKNSSQDKEKTEVALVFDETKTDSDTVTVDLGDSNVNRASILWSLDRYDDICNSNIKITVSDLKSVSNLADIYSLWINKNSDISWLNYCSNLDELELKISTESALKQIKGLNVYKLILSTGSYYKGKGSIIDERFFSFLKNCPNLSILEIDSSAFSINSDFLQKISRENGGLYLRIDYLSGSSQKINIDALKSFKRIEFNLDNGNGMYDIPIIFSKEEFNYIFNSETFSVRDENGYLILDSGSLTDKYKDYVKEVNKIYDQIDKIISTLNINEKMSDKEKLSAVLEYVLQNLTYNEDSAKIQREQGVQVDILGNLNEDLAEEMKKSYTDGFLYGVFNENGKPVCGNYSALMKTLLTKVGVESYMVRSSKHVYNLVNVDGEYYYVDATFLDNDTIDLDKVIEDNSHLIMPGVPVDSYDTTITPFGVDMPEFDIEKRVDQIIYNAKKDYIIKFNNQLYNISFTMLMSILAGLGLAVSKKKLEKIEDKEVFDSLGEDLKLQMLIKDFELAKAEYDKSNPLKKAYLNLSGKANFKGMQEEIDERKGIKK